MKEFTLKQLFSVVDGRLSTKVYDVYDILNNATGENLMTHHLPTAMKYIAIKKPEWYQKAHSKIEEIKNKIGDDFDSLMNYLDENCNEKYSVGKMAEEQMNNFVEYMVENSLLLNKK